MKKLQLFLVIIFISGKAFAQAPQLTSPPNHSEFQPAKNLILQWESIQDNSVYQVQYATDSIFSTQNILADLSLGGNFLTIDHLNNNKVYYWRVRLNTQNAPWSEVWSFKTTGLPVPAQIFNPANNLVNQNTPLLFNWSGNEVNTKYTLELSKDPGFAESTFDYLVNDTTSYTVDDLDNNSVYYWHVKSYNIDDAESEWSDTYHFKTKLADPVIIGPENNTRNLDTAVTFTWQIIDGAAKYNFQLATDSLFGSSSLFLNKDTIANQLFIDSLKNNSIYFWRVSASNLSGDSSGWSKIRNFKTRLFNSVLLFPVDSVRNSDTVVTFRWTKVDSANHYSLHVSTDSLFNNLVENKITDSSNFKIDSLLFNQRYYWRIMGSNENGDQSNWQDHTFKTMLKVSVLLSPKNRAKNIPVDTEFQWGTIIGADSFRIQVSYDSLFAKHFIDTVSADSVFKPDSLSFDTTYYWRAKGFNTEGDSSKWTGSFTFKTVPALLFTPDSISDVINLSLRHIDSLTTISVNNYGKNPYIIDSIKVKPDSVFSIDKNNAIISPGEKENFKVTFKPLVADTGLTRGTVIFIRKNTAGSGQVSLSDTLLIRLNLVIQKANAAFSDSTLSYDSIDATSKSIKQVMIRNYGGNITLKIDSLSILGEDTSAFKLTAKPKSVASNDSAAFFIEFKPQRLGLHTASVYIQTNSYPDTIIVIPVTAYGRGGELAPATISRMNELQDSVFEALSDNNKPITFVNNGNAALDVSVSFAQKKFKLENDFLNNFSVKRGDSVTIKVKYTIPDFRKTNKDTMRIIHDGFGKDTLLVFLEGIFDSLSSAKKLQSDLRLNAGQFSVEDKIVNDNTELNYTLDPDLLSSYPNLSFRINYFTGGNGDRISAENDGSYNFLIPREIVDNRGLVLSGQMLSKDKNNKIIDSVTVFPPINVQVILKNYSTTEINIPKSVPAEKPENANVKWIMFGFPFDEVAADSVFKDFGGIQNMKDGEWVVYQYNFAVQDSFSFFSGYSFEPNKAYFAAQSLRDTFKISYRYTDFLRTRKLTDSVLTLPGTNWKTISSPFLFDVQVDPSVVLRRYDTNNKVYKMTNIMKPGEGYFVEPSVSQIKLQTFGEYNPLFYPKILADIGWHLKITASDKNVSVENLLSIINTGKVTKTGAALPEEYASSPRLQKGLTLFINSNENKNLDVYVKEGKDGSVFDFTLFNDLQDDQVDLSAVINGTIPQNIIYRIFDNETKGIVEDSLKNFYLKKDKHYTFKIIIGTGEYIKKTLAELSNQIPTVYSLSQNYPNPFNPATTINYQVPENSHVSIKIYDALGAEVRTLVNEEKSAGYYKVNFDARNFASGVYFYRIIAKNYVAVKKMIVLK